MLMDFSNINFTFITKEKFTITTIINNISEFILITYATINIKIFI